MKTRRNNFLLSRIIIGALAVTLAAQLPAQTVTQIAGGALHSLFVKSDGSLWGMGDNEHGQLGLGPALIATNLPVEIVSNGAATPAAGYSHSLYQQSNVLWAMGDNEYGQLGDGTTNNHYVPEQVNLLGPRFSFSAIAAGAFHSLFASIRISMGTGTFLDVMGWNASGQLGDSTTNNHTAAETVASFGTGAIVSVAGGYNHSLYVLPDGSLWGMGDNTLGELGPTLHSTNNQVMILSSNVVAVAAGLGDSFFIKSDGTLWAMGNNAYGELGDGGKAFSTNMPELVLTGVVAVAAGQYHALCIRSDGTLWGTGNNTYGQLGDGTTTPHLAWFPIGVSNVVAIAAGEFHSLFIKSDGSLWGMGDNEYGQLGTGDYNNPETPVEIVPPPPPTTQWNIVWSDEFNGTSINTSNWTYDLGAGGWGNQELETYTSDPQNSYVSNGLLHIVVQSDGGTGYTSARMKSQGLYNTPIYGRFQWRAALPSGTGMWPALWMLGSDFPSVPWPTCGEIDVVENNGATPTWVQGSLHSDSGGPTGIYNLPNGESTTNFHIYELDWSPTNIQWLVDGYVYETQSSGAPFNAPFFFLMNVAVGGNYVGNPDTNQIDAGTVFPQEMLVDYVRVLEPTAPLAISMTPPSNGKMTLSWPTNIVCHLQMQKNSLVGGWTDLPVTSPYVVTPDPTQRAVFYRLQSP